MSRHTIYTEEERRAHRKASQKRYQQADAYKAYQKRYHQTDTYKAYHKRYQHTDAFKASQKRYQHTDAFKEYQKRYRQTDAFKASPTRYIAHLLKVYSKELAKVEKLLHQYSVPPVALEGKAVSLNNLIENLNIILKHTEGLPAAQKRDARVVMLSELLENEGRIVSWRRKLGYSEGGNE